MATDETLIRLAEAHRRAGDLERITALWKADLEIAKAQATQRSALLADLLADQEAFA
jgi:hypothetical protein